MTRWKVRLYDCGVCLFQLEANLDTMFSGQQEDHVPDGRQGIRAQRNRRRQAAHSRRAPFQCPACKSCPPFALGVETVPDSRSIQRRPIHDTVAKNALDRFEKALRKKFADQLEGVSEEDFRKLDHLNQLFEFLDAMPEVDEDEAEQAQPKKRAPRGSSKCVFFLGGECETEFGMQSGNAEAEWQDARAQVRDTSSSVPLSVVLTGCIVGAGNRGATMTATTMQVVGLQLVAQPRRRRRLLARDMLAPRESARGSPVFTVDNSLQRPEEVLGRRSGL